MHLPEKKSSNFELQDRRNIHSNPQKPSQIPRITERAAGM